MTGFALLFVGVCGSVFGQSPFRQEKLAFVLPNLFGENGLRLDSTVHRAHFDSSFQANFGPFNSAVASQLTSLPIPSPASGFTYSFDDDLGTYTRSATSFGPILAERAETIGKEQFSFGFTTQHFGFDKMDDLELSSFPALFQHSPTVDPNSPFLKDLISARNSIDFRITQATAFFSYGVTDALDVSVALPFINTELDARSQLDINRIGTHDDPTFPHTFQEGQDVAQGRFSNGSSASGIGDVIFRIKGTATRWEKAALALGADVRLPTGDELNFLGSGAAGFKPFAVVSSNLGRVSPHANFGFQFNGESILAGDVVTGVKAALPNQFTYSFGADIGVSEKMTFAADLLGRRLVDANIVGVQNFSATDGTVFPILEFAPGGVNQTDASVGFKVNPAGTVLVTFNVLMRVGGGGLRADIVPLFGISMTP